VAYRIVLGGDRVVSCAVDAGRFDSRSVVVNPAPDDLLPRDRDTVAALGRTRALTSQVDEAIRTARPAVACSNRDAWALPRIAPGRAVIHLVNRAYDSKADAVRPLTGVELACDLRALGVPRATRARVVSFGGEPKDVPVTNGRLAADVPGAWTIVELTG
jgi:hypothetical protein